MAGVAAGRDGAFASPEQFEAISAGLTALVGSAAAAAAVLFAPQSRRSSLFLAFCSFRSVSMALCQSRHALLLWRWTSFHITDPSLSVMAMQQPRSPSPSD